MRAIKRYLQTLGFRPDHTRKSMKELGNVFFSKEQLEVSIKRLGELDPFFGTVFLAFKENNLPEGETKNLKNNQ